MESSDRQADLLPNVKAATGCGENDVGWGEGVVVGELDPPMVQASRVHRVLRSGHGKVPLEKVVLY